MTREELFSAIGRVSPAWLEESEQPAVRPQKRGAWVKWTALAACAVLAIGFAKFVTTGAGSKATSTAVDTNDAPAESPAVESPAEEAPDSASTENAVPDLSEVTDGKGGDFSSYQGPVLPLTLAEKTDAVSAERTLTMDFRSFSREAINYTDENGDIQTFTARDNDVLLTDRYILTNTADHDVTVTALWPFTGDVNELNALTPTVTLDGAQTQTKLYAGGYSGGFAPVYGDIYDLDSRSNLRYASSFSDYAALLADGSYLADALSDLPDLSQTVTVYRFENSAAPKDADAATLAVSFAYDQNSTTILTYDFNGWSYNERTSETTYSYFTRSHRKNGTPELRFLAVLGDDIGDMTMQGYRNGACETGNELDGVSADVTREEMTLVELLQLSIDNYLRSYGNSELRSEAKTLLLRCTVALLTQYGVLSDNPAERYDDGRLEDAISEAASLPRVFYAAFDVTIPAGESVTVTIHAAKPCSQNFYDCDHGDTTLRGVEVATVLGSNLNLTGQTAALNTRGIVMIVDQNFGFDDESEESSVLLDAQHPVYYLDIHVPEA